MDSNGDPLDDPSNPGTPLSNVTDTLKGGGKVALVGFGTFSVSARSARTGRNPQTGAEIQIAAKNVAKFKAGAGLNDAVN